MKLEDLFIFLVILLVIAGAAYVLAGLWPNEANEAPKQQTQTNQDYQTQLAIAQMNAQISELNTEVKQANAQQAQQTQQQQQYLTSNAYYTERYLANFDTVRATVYDLTVEVEDKDSGDAIEGARVEVNDASSASKKTSSSGRAYFSNLKEDCYDVSVSMNGYFSDTRSICLHDDRTLTISLEPKSN